MSGYFLNIMMEIRLKFSEYFSELYFFIFFIVYLIRFNSNIKRHFLISGDKKAKMCQNSWALDARVARWTLDATLWKLGSGH